MASFHDLTTAQLKQAVQIREQIESLQAKLDALLGGSSSTPTKGKRTVSAATKKKMAAAQAGSVCKVENTDSSGQSSRANGGKEKGRNHCGWTGQTCSGDESSLGGEEEGCCF